MSRTPPLDELFTPETERLPVGALVTFLGGSDAQSKWGSGYAGHSQLEVGGVYYISRIEVHTWHTKVWLGEGDLGPFNSVCFEVVPLSRSDKPCRLCGEKCQGNPCWECKGYIEHRAAGLERAGHSWRAAVRIAKAELGERPHREEPVGPTTGDR